MFETLLRWLAKFLLGLRYRVTVHGLQSIAQRGRRGILFLPNHPGLIDPIIVVTFLHRMFRPRPLADEDQVERPGVRWVLHKIRVLPIPDLAKEGAGVAEQVQAVVKECAAALQRGDNIVLYPSGSIYRSRYENLRGNSGVESILRQAPDVRVVLVRSRGLWGSSFTLASGVFPTVAGGFKRHFWTLLKNLVFFTPRRHVTLDLHEPDDLPRDADRSTLNQYLERWYNEDAPPATYVPYHFLERGGVQEMPDPQLERVTGSPADVSPTTRRLVYEHLKEVTDRDDLTDELDLARDLGLDSLARTEILLWLGREFGFHAADAASLRTVGDVLLAARGEAAVVRPIELAPTPKKWFAPRGQGRVTLPDGDNICSVFLRQARRNPGRVVVADQRSGAKTFRDLITAIFALRPHFATLPGENIGIMLPASVGATTATLAALFAGKTPLLINWTTGTRNILHALELLGVERIVTAQQLVARIESQGTDLSPLRDRLVFIEEIGAGLSRGEKLGAALRARFAWGGLRRVTPRETAAILVTSGSESLPKAVPLTHASLLVNLRDVLTVAEIRDDDALLGFLPPFHSFGLAIGVLLPVLGGLRVVYHANPTDAWILARLTAAYRASVVCGTPTFLSGILRAAGADDLASLRLAVTGAEKCPERVYEMFAERCPHATVVEGYGVTECSPIISVNDLDHPQHGTIGRVLPSYEYALVDVDSGERAAPGEIGMLLVRGPSVFGGYVGAGVKSPFVEFEGKSWYRTGDLVSEGADGVLTFRGRLKRFIKLGGEMISLPAIEAVLKEAFEPPDAEEPVIAVEATPEESHPEVVLFTTRGDIDRAAANKLIRAAHLSPLHNIARVERIEAIPQLGTGKTDYKQLKALLGASTAQAAG